MNRLEWAFVVILANGHLLKTPVLEKLFPTEAECWSRVNEINEKTRETWAGVCIRIEDVPEQFPTVAIL